MDDSLVTLSLSQFADEVASGNPTPGGGAAAALAGALGASLVSMVCHFTVGREKFAAVEDQVQSVLKQADDARGRFLAAVDADAQAYAAVGDAYRLPRATDAEKSARSEAIRAASWMAAQPPLNIAEPDRSPTPCWAAMSRQRWRWPARRSRVASPTWRPTSPA
jgi:formiminotetrahydrofolate cyclodeaminase